MNALTLYLGVTVIAPWSVPVAAAASVDAAQSRLPNRIVLPGLAATLALAATASIVHTQIAPFAGSLVGALLLGLTFLIVHLLQPHGFGFGDVKYGALIGAGLGALSLALVLLAYVLAIPVHAAVLRWRWWPAQRAPTASPRVAPFGPSLALGAASALLIVFVVRLAGS